LTRTSDSSKEQWADKKKKHINLHIFSKNPLFLDRLLCNIQTVKNSEENYFANGLVQNCYADREADAKMFLLMEEVKHTRHFR
jgi:hypothetical protein